MSKQTIRRGHLRSTKRGQTQVRTHRLKTRGHTPKINSFTFKPWTFNDYNAIPPDDKDFQLPKFGFRDDVEEEEEDAIDY